MTKKEKWTYTTMEALSAVMIAVGLVFTVISAGNTRMAFAVMALTGLIMFAQSRTDRRKIKGINQAEVEAIESLHFTIDRSRELVNH